MPRSGHGGRKPKGTRDAVTLRAPVEHMEFYRAEAARLELSLGDYFAIVMAQATGLERPDYLPAQPELFEQPKLPISA